MFPLNPGRHSPRFRVDDARPPKVSFKTHQPAALRGPAPGRQSPNQATETASTYVSKPVSLTAPAAAEPRRRTAAAAAAVAVAEPQTKTVQLRARRCRLVAAAECIPHPDKVHKGGEDAHFVSRAGLGAIGIADGVGGWVHSGIDPTGYARAVMAAVKDTLEGDASLSCIEAMHAAHTSVELPGSCTAIVARLWPGNKLDVANLGDSSLRVVRGDAVHFRTSPLQHAFNMPFQLGHPAHVPDTDTPADANTATTTLQAGDVIVMGSDGLFDNVWDDEIVAVVRAAGGGRGGGMSHRAVREAAQELAYTARAHSMDRLFKSPWSVECARRAGASPSFLRKLFPKGGKLDDITVVLAVVTETDGHEGGPLL